MAVRVRFVGGSLNGQSDDLAPDEVLGRSPMYIGGWDGAANEPRTDIYVVTPSPDADGVYTFNLESHGAPGVMAEGSN